MTNILVLLLLIFLIKYITTITVYLYGLHLVTYFCNDKINVDKISDAHKNILHLSKILVLIVEDFEKM